jgi:predicted MFS family arabinose efflux permease
VSATPATSAPSPLRAALTAPGAPVVVLASLLGRLPVTMYSLGTLLYVQATTGSFATAGAVSAGALVGVALGSVVQGRVVDRLGPTRPLLATAVLSAAATAGAVAAVESGAALPVLVGLAVLVGLTQPVVSSASRMLWGRLVPPGPVRDAAYAYEAISLEVFFIAGPAVVALLVAVAPWPGTGLAIAAGVAVVGTVCFALAPAVRAVGPAPPGTSAGPLGVLLRPGVLTVVVAALGFGIVIGGFEVGLPAVTQGYGSATWGGYLLAGWSVAAVLAGLAYAPRPFPRPLPVRLPVLLAFFAACAALTAAAALGPLPLLAAAVLLTGTSVTAQATAHSLVLDVVAPPGTATEAFGWVVTAATVGIAAGQSVGGVAVEAIGPPAPMLLGGLAGAVLAGVVWLRRATLGG